MLLFKRSLVAIIGLLLVQCTAAAKKQAVPAFVSNKKPDTHFFEQVIHKKNSTEVLFYFKFNYKRNEVSIYRPDSEHTDVGFEVNKYFSSDSSFLYIELDYYEREGVPFKEVRQEKGKSGFYEPFSFSDEPQINLCNCAHAGKSFLFARNGDDYSLVDASIEDEEEVSRLRHFVFDENSDEQYFLRLKTGDKLVSYPKQQ